MTKDENTQRIKNEALNAIRKIYNTGVEKPYSNFPEDGSYESQRDDWVCAIIRKMEEELKKIKDKK